MPDNRALELIATVKKQIEDTLLNPLIKSCEIKVGNSLKTVIFQEFNPKYNSDELLRYIHCVLDSIQEDVENAQGEEQSRTHKD